MATTVGLVFPVKEDSPKKESSKIEKVITSKGKKKKAEKTKEDIEFEEAEK